MGGGRATGRPSRGSAYVASYGRDYAVDVDVDVGDHCS